MPFYEVQCNKCNKIYDVRSTMEDMKKNIKKAVCECGSKSKTTVISVPNFNFANPEGTKKYNSSHDLRYHHALERPGGAKDQREFAEQFSHVGGTPYNSINDIDSGKHFGAVK
jgi:putative FmdB family regulatory protein